MFLKNKNELSLIKILVIFLNWMLAGGYIGTYTDNRHRLLNLIGIQISLN